MSRALRPVFRRTFSTGLNGRFVKMESSKFEFSEVYPTAGNGHDFRMKIFGLYYDVETINRLQDCIWNDQSFLPSNHATLLPKSSGLADLSEIGSKMAVQLVSGEPGLLAKNMLRATVKSTLTNEHFMRTMNLIKLFKENGSCEIAQQISDVAFWVQWLIRGYLFEGKLHYEVFCEDYVPGELAKIAFATNAALSRLQVEFVYDDYTLKAARFPDNFNNDAINFDDPQSILQAIASIETPVGFNDVAGGSPEHNFRHNHSLMEYQMKDAFIGVGKILSGQADGWELIISAAKRANRVFKTMLTNTPPGSYPAIRLPIKGVRGACGTVYHKHGVFYEGVGTDVYTTKDNKTIQGVYIDNEWGQTGANSSMYKYFDILIGVADVRNAFGNDPMMIKKMQNVFTGKADSGELGTNPIDSMQRAFDLFTRPVKHMKLLVSTANRVAEAGVLKDKSIYVLLSRLRLAYWVAEHRMTHGKYVLKAIYQTEPVGGQSRADGTGGSTPPFLKTFLDQTLGPARAIIIDLLLSNQRETGVGDSGRLSAEELQEIASMSAKLDMFERQMGDIRDKGDQLEFDEKVGNYH